MENKILENWIQKWRLFWWKITCKLDSLTFAKFSRSRKKLYRCHPNYFFKVFL